MLNSTITYLRGTLLPAERFTGFVLVEFRSKFIFLHKICQLSQLWQDAVLKDAVLKLTYFSNTTPNTCSTSPLSPLPVIFAKQSAAERKLSAASTMSISSSSTKSLSSCLPEA